MHSVYNDRESLEKRFYLVEELVLGQSVVFTGSVLCLAWVRHLSSIWSHLDQDTGSHSIRVIRRQPPPNL